MPFKKGHIAWNTGKPAWNRVQLDKPAVIARYSVLKSLRKVAKEFDVSMPTISRVLRENNIPRDGKSIMSEEKRQSLSLWMKTRHANGEFLGESSGAYKGGKISMKCCICNKEMLRWKSHISKSKNCLCSKKCCIEFHKKEATDRGLGRISGDKHYKWNPDRRMTNCPVCNKKFHQPTNGQTCCCWECRTKYFVGDKTPNWQGGITGFRARLRGTLRYKTWRSAVFARDGYTCQECHKTGALQVHHIEPFAVILDKYNIDSVISGLNCLALWDVDNGQTLCQRCHKKIHLGLRKCYVA